MRYSTDDPLYDHSLSIKEHIRRAERHTEIALSKAYLPNTRRSYFYRAALGRAQNILIKLYIKEIKKD